MQLLTKFDFYQLQLEVRDINAELEWLNPDFLHESFRINQLIDRLEQIQSTLHKAVKLKRIHDSGLKIAS